MAFSSTTELKPVHLQPTLAQRLKRIDKRVMRFLAQHSLLLLRISIGIVYVWFGTLKFFPGVSPIEGFIREAMPFLPGDVFLPVLAAWEIAIGLGFISGKFTRATVILMLLQMGGAMSPIVLRPDLVFASFPYGWTLVGQYIFKDIILISAGLVILATARGATLREKAR